MNRWFALLLVIATLVAFSSADAGPAAVCGGVPRLTPLGAAEFRATLDSVAAGWNSDRSEAAASCFTEAAVYLEPPDRQLFRGRAAIRAIFAASIHPARPDRMAWHAVAFDSVRQAGFGEYTYRGSRNYHGIAVLQLETG
jgi:hypothetical protein